MSWNATGPIYGHRTAGGSVENSLVKLSCAIAVSTKYILRAFPGCLGFWISESCLVLSRGTYGCHTFSKCWMDWIELCLFTGTCVPTETLSAAARNNNVVLSAYQNIQTITQFRAEQIFKFVEVFYLQYCFYTQLFFRMHFGFHSDFTIKEHFPLKTFFNIALAHVLWAFLVALTRS